MDFRAVRLEKPSRNFSHHHRSKLMSRPPLQSVHVTKFIVLYAKRGPKKRKAFSDGLLTVAGTRLTLTETSSGQQATRLKEKDK